MITAHDISMSGTEDLATQSRPRAESNFNQTQVDDFSPKIIALYGLPGSGKSRLLKKLTTKLGHKDFYITEGSADIDLICREAGDGEGDGLKRFQVLSDEEKEQKKELATQRIRETCEQTQRHGVVAAHLTFWPENGKVEEVWTAEDEKTYTHMLYLHVDVKEIQRRQTNDNTTKRPYYSADHLWHWQDLEMKTLEKYCRKHDLLFVAVQDDRDVEQHIKFLTNHEDAVMDRLATWADRPEHNEVDTVLVFDADKTLAAQDSGKLFCRSIGEPDAMKDIFGSPPVYSAATFYKVMLLYERTVPASEWDERCGELAEHITIRPEFVDLLQKATKKSSVGVVVVVTCGIGKVWKMAPAKQGLGDAVTVIGNGRRSDKLLVTKDVQERVVEYLQKEKNAIVWALGDGQLDMPTLQQADQAVVVVGDEAIRSKSMDEELIKSISKNGLLARQMLLPSTVEPRPDSRLLPVVHSADIIF